MSACAYTMYVCMFFLGLETSCCVHLRLYVRELVNLSVLLILCWFVCALWVYIVYSLLGLGFLPFFSSSMTTIATMYVVCYTHLTFTS